DVKYEPYLHSLEQQARAAGRGLWGSTCKGSSTVPPPAPPAPPAATSAPRPTSRPTAPPAKPPSSTGKVIISYINYDGQEYRTEGDEYAVIKNTGSASVNLQGYTLNAGDAGQDFVFPSFVLKPGQEVRVYTNQD